MGQPINLVPHADLLGSLGTSLKRWNNISFHTLMLDGTDVTSKLNTPDTVSGSTSNLISSGKHTHSLSITKNDVGLSNVVNADTTTTSNITDSSNKRFVTDAELTVLSHTSGTNSGDISLSSPNSGLSLSSQVISMGTPSSVSDTSSNSITSSTHTHAISGIEVTSNKSSSVITDATSTTKYPSVKAIKDYADGLVVGLLDYRGGYDASGNTYPTTGGSGTAGAILKGDMWVISVGGTLSGVAIQVGDSIIANADTPAQIVGNWNTVNSNISYVPEDSANKVTSITGSSTNTQYPSAKLLYDQLALKAPIANPTFTGVVTAPSVNGLTLTAQTNGFTISGGTTSKTLTVALDASVSGTNTGDVSLATNNGLSLTNQVLAMGTPSTVSGSTTNSVTTSTHTHALTVTKSDVGLSNVENTALSTWAGSSNLVTLGTITTGTWHGSILDSTYGGTGINNGGRTLTLSTNSGTLSFTNASTTLTVANTASITGTNTGDVTLATNNGLSLSNQVLNMGTPSTVTGSTTNSVTTNTHTHALTVTKTDVGLSAVENTALSTWAGTSNLVTLGTVTSGTWNGGVISPTYGGTGVNNSTRTLTISTNAGTISFTNPTTTLTVANTASVSGTNTGDVVLASPNSGLDLSNQTLSMGTPTTVSNTSTNSVTTNSHTHALSTKRTYTWVINTPGVGGIAGPRIPSNGTVVRVDSYVTAATSATFNIQQRSTIGTTGTNVLSASMVATTTGVSSSSFSDSSLTAGNWLWIQISAISGTPGQLCITVTFTEP